MTSTVDSIVDRSGRKGRAEEGNRGSFSMTRTVETGYCSDG